MNHYAVKLDADDEDYDSPYIQSARSEGMDLPWWQKLLSAKFENGQFQVGKLSGGKLDDITVVVARVSETPGFASSRSTSSSDDASLGQDSGSTPR
jgi:hypothetical protein